MQSHEDCHQFVTMTLAHGTSASTVNTDVCPESRMKPVNPWASELRGNLRLLSDSGFREALNEANLYTVYNAMVAACQE